MLDSSRVHENFTNHNRKSTSLRNPTASCVTLKMMRPFEMAGPEDVEDLEDMLLREVRALDASLASPLETYVYGHYSSSTN